MSERRTGRRLIPAAVLSLGVTAALLTAAPAQAVVGGPAEAGDYLFSAEIQLGDGEHSCSGLLVAPQWIATAASCFDADSEAEREELAGKPDVLTVATIGRTDLNATSTGQVAHVVQLVPRQDRDLILGRLAKPVSIAPAKLATAPPEAGDTLTAAGYGRTASEWVPERLHSSTFTVTSVDSGSMAIAGAEDSSAICKGDAGGPVLREQDGHVEVVALSSRSWRHGCLGSDESKTGAVTARLDDLTTWITKTVTAAPVTDFNCDGQRDIAIADPQATVGTDAKAGLVRISYGGGKGTTEISEDMATVPGGAEPGDQFGETMATVDYNLDGCTDLIAGAWHEDLRGEANAGLVTLVYGSPDGLGQGQNGMAIQQGLGTGTLESATPQAGDHLGYALAAGTTTDGDPYIIVGAPGEDYDGFSNPGTAYYLHDGTNVGLAEVKPGYSGDPEDGDHFGAAIAASPEHIAIGAPGETLGGNASAGAVQILSHDLNSDGLPTPIEGLDQDSEKINGGAEDGDLFGSALAMVAYRPTGSPAATDSILAIGSYGEDIGTSDPDAGRVVTMHITASGTVTQLADIQQDIAGVSGGTENGDRFGEQVTAVNTAPGKVSTPQTLLLAVGIPGENLSGEINAGAVQIFSLLGAPGDSDIWLEPGLFGLPGTPTADQDVGSSIHAIDTGLYVGMPYGPAPLGAAHYLPWENITNGATQPVTTYQPGTGGFPAEGKTFGTVVR